MSILRRTAHVLLAAPFIVNGIDALRNPDAHAEKAEEAWGTLEDWGAPALSTRKLRIMARASGAASLGLGIAYVFGPAKRVTSSLMAVSTLPLAAIDASIALSGTRNQRRVAGKSIMANGVLFAGLTLASLDRNGKPSLKWRREFSREQKQAIAAAKASVVNEK